MHPRSGTNKQQHAWNQPLCCLPTALAECAPVARTVQHKHPCRVTGVASSVECHLGKAVAAQCIWGQHQALEVAILAAHIGRDVADVGVPVIAAVTTSTSASPPATAHKHSSINDCICCGFWLTVPLTATIGWRLEQSQHATPPRITTTSIRPSINQCKLHLCPPHRHNPTTTSQTPNPFQAAQMDSPLPQVARHCLAHRAAPATDSTQPGCFCCLCLSAAWYTTTSQRLLDAQHNPHHHGLHPAKAANHWGLLCLHPLTPPPHSPTPTHTAKTYHCLRSYVTALSTELHQPLTVPSPAAAAASAACASGLPGAPTTIQRLHNAQQSPTTSVCTWLQHHISAHCLFLHPVTPPHTHTHSHTAEGPTIASGHMSLPCLQSCTSR